jgi:hypothetical protein
MSRRGTAARLASREDALKQDTASAVSTERAESFPCSKVARVKLGRLFYLGDYLADAITLRDSSWAIFWCA